MEPLNEEDIYLKILALLPFKKRRTLLFIVQKAINAAYELGKQDASLELEEEIETLKSRGSGY